MSSPDSGDYHRAPGKAPMILSSSDEETEEDPSEDEEMPEPVVVAAARPRRVKQTARKSVMPHRIPVRTAPVSMKVARRSSLPPWFREVQGWENEDGLRGESSQELHVPTSEVLADLSMPTLVSRMSRLNLQVQTVTDELSVTEKSTQALGQRVQQLEEGYSQNQAAMEIYRQQLEATQAQAWAPHHWAAEENQRVANIEARMATVESQHVIQDWRNSLTEDRINTVEAGAAATQQQLDDLIYALYFAFGGGGGGGE